MSGFQSLVDAAKGFACSLYENVPGPLIPNPINDTLRFAWDELCKPPLPNPPPPETPFTGGQCCELEYKVTIKSVYTNGTPTSIVELPNSYQGTILGLTTRLVSSGGSPEIETRLSWKKCDGRVLFERTSLQDANFPVLTQSIVSVRTTYGEPDICGNPPISYPTGNPVPPNGYNSPPTPIPLNDGTNIDVTFNLVPPTPSGTGIPPIIVNVVRPEFNFPITFEFNGEINIGGNGGGGGFNQDDRDTINNINNVNNENNTKINNVTEIVTNVSNNANYNINIDRNKPRPDSDFQPSPPPKPPGKHEKEFLEAVIVNLLEIPQNAKSQSGSGAPNVFYAGWFEFRRKDKCFPREPINFAGGVFKAPVGADGYAYTLYTGFVGEAIEIINKEVE